MDSGEILDLGRWVERNVEPVFRLFQEQSFAPTVSGLILGAAVAFALYFVSVYAIRISWRVRSCTSEVRAAKDAEVFAKNFPKIDAEIRRSSLLKHTWEQFSETLIRPDPDEPNAPRVVRNTARPQDYFNSQEVGLHFRFFRSLPNLFVGIGLLFTFIGLVSALYFASKGIETNEVQKTQDALRNLLHAATFKFYTSVAGLGGSLILTFVLRLGTNLIEGSFEEFSRVVESRIVRTTPESLAFQQFQELQKQTVHLMRFNDEVAITVGRYVEEALNKSLPEHLVKAMEPISESLTKVTNNLSRMNEDALKGMADDFGKTIQGAAAEQIRGLANVVSDIKAALDGMREKMDQGGSELAEHVRRSTEDMRGALVAMTGAITEISAKIEGSVARGGEALDRQLDAAGTALMNVAETIAAKLDAAMGRMSSGSEQAAAQFTEQLAASARDFQSTSAAIAARLEDAVSKIADAAKVASDRVASDAAGVGKALADGAANAGREAENAIRGAATGLTSALDGLAAELQESVSEMSSQLGKVVHELGAVEGALVRQRNMFEAVVQAARDTEASMGGAAKSIRDASAPLATAGQAIATGARTIEESIRTAERALSDSGAHMRTVAEGLENTFDAMKRAWADYDRRFAGVDANLEKAFSQILDHVQSNLTIFRDFTLKVDDKLAETVTRLSGGIEELNEFAVTIERATSHLKSSVDGLGVRVA